MFRKELIPQLKNHPMGLYDIAQLLETSLRDTEDDLRHLIKSLKHSDYRLIITPAHCRKWGFKFHKDKIHKPGKCPRCNGSWIEQPLIEIIETKHRH